MSPTASSLRRASRDELPVWFPAALRTRRNAARVCVSSVLVPIHDIVPARRPGRAIHVYGPSASRVALVPPIERHAQVPSSTGACDHARSSGKGDVTDALFDVHSPLQVDIGG